VSPGVGDCVCDPFLLNFHLINVVFCDCVSVVLGQNGWSVTYTTQSICALKGSTVKLTCSSTYPRGHKVTSTFWFTKTETGVEPEDLGQDPDYAGRLEYHGDKKKDCTLRITDLRESDSATYKFRFITDQEGRTYTGKLGVTLSVTGKEKSTRVEVTPEWRSESKTLSCSTTCILTGYPTYIWYKNGQHLDESTSPQYRDPVSSNYEDSYSCAVKGHEDLHSPAVCELSVRPSGEIVEGSSVTLTCSSDANPPVDKYTWYKRNVTSPKASGQSYSITTISSEDSGKYYCEAENTIASNNSTALNIIVAGEVTSLISQ
uniref:B-cell receptor CD22 n=1 Tax=Hucho hucho TaxID=62062 RepID=A0A4W5L8C7_9TELE